MSSLRRLGSKETRTPRAWRALHTLSTFAAMGALDKRRSRDVDEAGAESAQAFDHRLIGGKARRSRMHDVVDEVAAAVGVVADESAAGPVGVDGDQAVVNAVGPKTLQDDLAESIGAHRANKNRTAAAARRLVDEDARRATGIGARVGSDAPMTAALVGADKLDEKLADRSNCNGHAVAFRSTCICSSLAPLLLRVNSVVDTRQVLNITL